MISQGEEYSRPTESSATTSHSKGDEQGKVDIKRLVAVVPPPSILFSKERKNVREKRIRLLYDSSLGKDEAKISKVLADELNIKNYLEITVAGKKRFRFKAIIVDTLMDNDAVYVNPETMKMHGVADKSICTIRGVQ